MTTNEASPSFGTASRFVGASLPRQEDRRLVTGHGRYVDDAVPPRGATHACTCAVDAVTGRVTLLDYVVSEDCGVMINPRVVEGQIAGGVAQGIGGVLFEHFVYDDDGNPLTMTLLDYLLPTSTEMPMLEYHHIETPSDTPGGHKGMGEGGAIASVPAVINAIADAVSPFGVELLEQPFTPSRLAELIADARS